MYCTSQLSLNPFACSFKPLLQHHLLFAMLTASTLNLYFYRYITLIYRLATFFLLQIQVLGFLVQSPSQTLAWLTLLLLEILPQLLAMHLPLVEAPFVLRPPGASLPIFQEHHREILLFHINSFPHHSLSPLQVLSLGCLHPSLFQLQGFQA